VLPGKRREDALLPGKGRPADCRCIAAQYCNGRRQPIRRGSGQRQQGLDLSWKGFKDMEQVNSLGAERGFGDWAAVIKDSDRIHWRRL